ncbi:MAG: threonylcarbamoyl-AMP synthase [Ferruginibacter sp.]|nr:threonylcarbamoyl-AMP synthase [Ferruginibacter sp.]
MSIYKTEIGTDIDKAFDLLINGELVAIPTETVYGLAGNALSAAVVKKIFEAKNRPFTNPLIVHISGIDKLSSVVKNVPDIALQLLQTFSPGPLTLILPKKDVIPDFVTAHSSHVAVRIPNHSLCLELLKRLPFPLAAPSANKFTGISPTNPDHVLNQLSGQIPYILDGGFCNNGIESTIVGFENDTILVYRLGAITIEQLQRIHPHIKLANDHKVIHSPGMMKHHYAPKTPLVFTENVADSIKLFDHKNIAVLYFKQPAAGVSTAYEHVLSVSGNLTEAAANLYKALYELDKQNPDIIIAERLPDIGLGQSINDRLKRAAAK